MRIFTPAWYAQTQAGDATVAVWNDAFYRYGLHLAAICDRLPGSLRRFAGYSCHDRRFSSASLLPNSIVRLSIDGFRKTRAGRHPVEGQHVIDLKGVNATNLKPAHPGRFWLYEEVDMAAAAFRLSVLLDDGAVLWFVFSGLTVKRPQ